MILAWGHLCFDVSPTTIGINLSLDINSWVVMIALGPFVMFAGSKRGIAEIVKE